MRREVNQQCYGGVVEQPRKPLVVDELEEMLTLGDGGIVSDVVRKQIERSLFHMVVVERRRGEGNHGNTNASNV